MLIRNTCVFLLYIYWFSPFSGRREAVLVARTGVWRAEHPKLQPPRLCEFIVTLFLSRNRLLSTNHSEQNGDGGSFLACEDLGERLDESFLTCTFFLLFFFWVEISLHAPVPLFRPGSVHSGSASWDNCGWALPESNMKRIVFFLQQNHSLFFIPSPDHM